MLCFRWGVSELQHGMLRWSWPQAAKPLRLALAAADTGALPGVQGFNTRFSASGEECLVMRRLTAGMGYCAARG